MIMSLQGLAWHTSMVPRTEERRAAFSAALSRFPGHAQEIETLIGLNESFRDMCDELAEADTTLARIDRVPATAREARILECKDWIERLTKEIGEALGRSNVIPIAPAGGPKR